MVPAPLQADRRTGRGFVLRPGVRIQVARDPAAVAIAVRLATEIGREVDGPIAVAHEGSQAPGPSCCS